MTEEKLKCDLVIVSYNSYRYLENCLKSLVKECAESIHAIYVVNNGHENGINGLKGIFPHTVFIQNHKNLGFAKGVNIGLRNSEASYICLLNPDTIASENFLGAGLAYIEAHPTVGALGPKIYSEDGSVQGSARSFPTLLTSFFGRTSWLTRNFPNNSLSKKNMPTIGYGDQDPLEVDWVSGACMLVRREAVSQVGGMDERFFMYWEDADWCRRMQNGGWKIVYLPEAAIFHACGQSSKTRPLKSMLHFHKSCYQLYEKYTPSHKTWLLPVVLLGLGLRISMLMIGALLAQRSRE